MNDQIGSSSGAWTLSDPTWFSTLDVVHIYQRSNWFNLACSDDILKTSST
eukprot:m.76976 g.76976  ORF g.76976 m.76976 type:complete len:50 (+) comp24960_c1_seq2:136-285(+)